MKLWLITDEFPPDYGGGISMYADIVSRGFADAGHEVRVITASPRAKVEKVTDRLVYVRFPRPTGHEDPCMGYMLSLCRAYYQQTMALMDAVGAPDVIELPDYNAIGYYLLQAKRLGEKRLQRVKLVVHCHTPSFEIMRVNRSPEYAFPVYWIGQMERYCLAAADALVAPSRFMRERLMPYARGNRFDVIPLPYRFHQGQLPYEGGRHLLYAGRLEYRKGIWQLLKPMARLWERGERTPLVLVGGDTYFEPGGKTLGRMIREQYGRWIDEGLLKLHGLVPPQEVERLMAKAKAVLVPSIYENYPYTNITAMANGVPVLVSRQGGQAEAVSEDGVNGFIFDWEKEDDCYHALQRLLGLEDGELRAVGERGYRRMRALCGLDSNLPRREAFYQSVLRQPDVITPYPFLTPLTQTPWPEAVANSPELPGVLSVVIPYFNLGKTVEETVQSVLRSDYDAGKLEIILLDDGSTNPDSIRKAEELARQYPLRLERISNGGLANARNTGIRLARGEYVCFLDADDTVEPAYFRRCVEVLRLHENVSYVYSWVQYFENSHDIWVAFDTVFPYFCAQNQLTCMAVVRRKDYLAFGLNHPAMEYGLEDYDGWLGLAENGRMGVCIPEPLVNYRVRTGSMTRSMSMGAMIYLRSRLRELHPELYRQYGQELYLLLMENGTNLQWRHPLHSNTAYRADGALSEAEALSRELNAIKQRRGYRMMDWLATRVYGNRLVRALRFRVWPAVRERAMRRKRRRMDG